MTSRDNAIDYAQDMMAKGMSAGEANVEVVRMIGVQIVHGKMRKETRAALNAAVKDGRLGHLPKQGLRPEAYYHPSSRGNAIDARERAYCSSIKAIEACT